MKIWELLPIDPTDHNWRASTYSGKVIIRADTEERARIIATRAFGLAVEMQPGGKVPVLPWDYDWLVAAQTIESDKYDPDGDEAILDPAEYDGDWRR